MSQEELARQIGLNRGNIASYENGTAEPKICNLLKFARLFGIPVHQLTYSDLSREQNLDERDHIMDEGNPALEKMIRQLRQQTDQAEELIRSIRTCFHYRQESLSSEKKPEVQAFMIHFEDLYQVAEKLLCDHRALIELTKKNLPSKDL